MTDDSGYSDLGSYGGEIATPNLDKLAENGMRFKNCYNNGKCSPTRASLLTGQYPQKVGAGDLCRLQNETDLPGYLGYLNPNFPTLPQILKDNGYHTLMSGKWHLGGERVSDQLENGFPKPLATEYAKWPLGKGFEKFFGLIHGASGMYKPWPDRPYTYGTQVYDTQKHEGEFYNTDVFTDFALKFLDQIREKDGNPFFLYLPYTAPHNPLEAPKEVIQKYIDTYNTPEKLEAIKRKRFDALIKEGLIPKNWTYNKAYYSKLFKTNKNINGKQLSKLSYELATYAAMLDILDQNVGRLVQKLEAMGELDNTLILYLSDNGADGPGRCDIFNSPYYGVKTSLREGGIKSHLIAHWPKGISTKGTISDQQVHVIDIMPTCLNIANANYPKKYRKSNNLSMQGLNLLDNLTKNTLIERKYLFWDLYGQQAVIYNDHWKWYNDSTHKDFLFDLKNDGTETANLAPKNPDIIDKLKKAHAIFVKQNNIVPHKTLKAAQANNQWHQKNDK